MSAEEHLSNQFEIVQPHRLVRIGDRTYPAAHTMEIDGAKAAHIPMENGQLLRVSHFDDEPGKFYMHAPMKRGGKETTPGPDDRHSLRDVYESPRPFLRANGAELATKMIDGESTRPLKPEEQADAREQLKIFRNRLAT